MIETKRFSLVKPTLETPFSIDFEWWKQHDQNYRLYLYSCLCPHHQEKFSESQQDIEIDWIDPETAEVHSVDGIQHALMTHCARQPGFYTSSSMLVDSVFRALLAHGNEPMTPIELGNAINRPPETILRTFAGAQVYKGIRPRHS